MKVFILSNEPALMVAILLGSTFTNTAKERYLNFSGLRSSDLSTKHAAQSYSCSLSLCSKLIVFFAGTYQKEWKGIKSIFKRFECVYRKYVCTHIFKF